MELGPDGFAARLRYPNLAERIQHTMPESRVVNALNTVGPADLMAAPGGLATPPPESFILMVRPLDAALGPIPVAR